MTHYRIYVLDVRDRVAQLLERTFRTEREAVRWAEALRAGEHAAEVWQGERLIARTGGDLVLG